MRSTNVVPILTAAVSVAVLVGTVGAQSEPAPPVKSLSDVAEGFNRRVCAEGSVVDEEGRLLAGVTMRVRKYTFSLMAPDALSRESWDEVVNESFHVECSRCSGLDLVFFGRGYYHTTVSVRAEDQLPAGANCARTTVELERIPTPVKMTELRGALLFDLDGPREVVALGLRMTGPVRLGAGKTMDSLEAPFVFVVGEIGPGGSLAHKSMPKSSTDRKYEVPVGVRIVFSDPGDGVVLYEPQKHNPMATAEVFREMREAPESGYCNEIRFDELQRDTEWQNYYFYCKVGGLYGKGTVAGPVFANVRNQNAIRSGISLGLNPDGTRNVTTTR